MGTSLRDIASSLTSAVERRLFAEYGAIFVTTAIPPPRIIFSGPEQVEAFQASLPVKSATFGEHKIELQAEAMNALASAATEIESRGGSISARADDSGRRSYQDTVRLWNRNVSRGLEHWLSLGQISSERAALIDGLDPVRQVAIILDLEEQDHLYFGTFFDRSILYSVAAPGASQHLSMLAFDVAEFRDDDVESALNRAGWYRTVPNDFPHFTYLGHREATLGRLGLKQTGRDYDGRSYNFWIPDPEF